MEDRGKEKFSARQFSTRAAEKSSAGLLTLNKTQPLSSMPLIWLSGRARRRPAESFMPIMESIHFVGFHPEDSFGRSLAFVWNRGRRARQCHDGILLVINADRVAEP